MPKPFRLSTSNTRKHNNETSQGSEDRNPHYQSFKAKKVPNSHRVPFMVLHSAKNLTQPETFNLNTDKRSESRHRSSSNKEDQRPPELQEEKINSVNIADVSQSTQNGENDPSLGLLDIDIDDLIKQEETNQL